MFRYLLRMLVGLTAVGSLLGADATPAFRAARSVHLGYPAPDAEWFSNEMIVEKSVNGSYFMACGWNTGYFGIQQLNSPTNTVVIFSVWDPTQGDDPKDIDWLVFAKVGTITIITFSINIYTSFII